MNKEENAAGVGEQHEMSADRTGDVAARQENLSGRKREMSLVNTSVLAYIGDAVYETYVRRHVFHQGILRPDRLHSAAVKYVRAEGQAAAFEKLWDELTPDEQAVGRRGRNHKITSMPHNVDPKTYKTATAFEALVGYLNLSGDQERERYIIDRTFDIIENSEITMKRGTSGTKGKRG